MNISPNPTATFRHNVHFDKAYSSQSGMTNMGTKPYLVIFHCPVLSAYKNPSGWRMSGLVL
jgi:hypothetical protein